MTDRARLGVALIGVGGGLLVTRLAGRPVPDPYDVIVLMIAVFLASLPSRRI